MLFAWRNLRCFHSEWLSNATQSVCFINFYLFTDGFFSVGLSSFSIIYLLICQRGFYQWNSLGRHDKNIIISFFSLCSHFFKTIQIKICDVLMIFLLCCKSHDIFSFFILLLPQNDNDEFSFGYFCFEIFTFDKRNFGLVKTHVESEKKKQKQNKRKYWRRANYMNVTMTSLSITSINVSSERSSRYSRKIGVQKKKT